jgi:uncharacterized membrane protein
MWTCVGLGVVLACAAAGLSLCRFDALGNDNTDLAFYSRIVWGMAHGDRINPLLGAHDLGLHLMPVMVVFVPWSWLLPIPETLLVAQALALGSVAPLAYRAGVRLGGGPFAGVALAIAWVVHPTVLHVGCAEFHPGSLALPALVAAFTALALERDLEGVALLVVACTTREDVALVAAGAGLVVALRPGRRALGLAIAAGGLAWFSIYVLAIQPRFLPASGSMEAHFPGLGHDVSSVLATLLSEPSLVVQRLAEPGDAAYVAVLLLSVGGVCLLSPAWLVTALPPLLVNLLSSFPAATDVTTHYATLMLPGLFVAAAAGIGRLARWRLAGARAPALAALLLVTAALHAHLRWGATPLAMRFEAEPYVMDREERTLDWYARTIVEHERASVMAPASVIGHLAERRHIYSWAFAHPPPDVAILDTRGRQWVQLAPERWDHPMEREIERVDADPAYGLWRHNPPFRVMWRGLPGGRERLAAVSPGSVPPQATVQATGWDGHVRLLALESALTREREHFSGRYRSLFAVHTTFYWMAERELPADLLLRVVIEGTHKTHTRWYKPTWGVRDTSTWRVGEIIRDHQWSTSPGGWPLEALSATVVFVDGRDRPYPAGARPVRLRW